MRILVLVKHGYGESGGIARYSQDFLNALAMSDHQVDLTVLAQTEKRANVSHAPDSIRYLTIDANSKFLYLLTSLKFLFGKKFNYVFCMHLYLLPVACLFSWFRKSKILVCIHGIEAWHAKNVFFHYYIKSVNLVLSVSHYTLNKFFSWSNLDKCKTRILPNTIDLNLFRQGSRSTELQEKYSLENKLVILTVSRLHPGRDKGHAALIKALPALLRTHANLIYLIAGTGDDQERLQSMVVELGLEQHVYFVGFVSEEEKPKYYQLANVFFMAGEGEGFGIVYLEALACGCPVIASKLDASAEVLSALNTGILIDPNSEVEVRDAVLKSLQLEKSVPVGLERYSLNNFNKQVSQLLTDLER